MSRSELPARRTACGLSRWCCPGWERPVCGDLAPAPDSPKRGPAVPPERVVSPRLIALPLGGEQAVRRDVGARADPLLVGDERSVDVGSALQVTRDGLFD